MEEERVQQKLLVLDWDELLPSQEDEPPPTLVIKPTITKPLASSVMDSNQQHILAEESKKLSDFDLDNKIRTRKHSIDTIASKLPDNGEKLRFGLQILEEERERRKLRRIEKEADGCAEPSQSTDSSIVGASNGFRRETASSQASSPSSFATCFSRKMEENTDCRSVNAFHKELSVSGRCDSRKMKYNGKLKGRHKGRSSSRQEQFKSPRNLWLHEDRNVSSNGDPRGRGSSVRSLHHIVENLSSCAAKKDNLEVQHSIDLRPRKGQAIVLVDEEEPQVIETTEYIDECMKDAKIYYPSRDDPECVEICYADIKCLDPEGYLTSNIMNFYIRYLQQHTSPTNRARHDYHFFNTYFYKKLKEVGSYKGNNRDAFFVKFRRWWKGVNIFQKSYLLIPIHEDLHWSLVIICIPDKEDESGPIILHLDSLALHSSRSIFDDIRRFLEDEWHYLDKEVAASDLPISDRIWKYLPRRIEKNIIAVPQQKNEYDCGLFVLYFMERFIEEAPERLKKKDLAMFGKQWFKPEEASSLRAKIKNLLKKEFQKCSREVNALSASSSVSLDDPPEE